MQKDRIKAAKNGDAAKVRALLEAETTLIGALDTDGSTPQRASGGEAAAITAMMVQIPC